MRNFRTIRTSGMLPIEHSVKEALTIYARRLLVFAAIVAINIGIISVILLLRRVVDSLQRMDTVSFLIYAISLILMIAILKPIFSFFLNRFGERKKSDLFKQSSKRQERYDARWLINSGKRQSQDSLRTMRRDFSDSFEYKVWEKEQLDRAFRQLESSEMDKVLAASQTIRALDNPYRYQAIPKLNELRESHDSLISIYASTTLEAIEKRDKDEEEK